MNALGLPSKNLGGLPRSAVQRGHALLPVEQQLHHPSCQGTVTAVSGRLRFGGPDQKTTDGAAQVQRSEQLAHRVPIPGVATLKLGQCHMAAVDVIEDGGYLHCGERCQPDGGMALMNWLTRSSAP